jgi:methyl-accepting chemotaxis protein
LEKINKAVASITDVNGVITSSPKEQTSVAEKINQFERESYRV